MTTTADGERVLTAEGYCAADEERWAPEPPKSPSRTAFQRDRARLIHSSALRRLAASVVKRSRRACAKEAASISPDGSQPC